MARKQSAARVDTSSFPPLDSPEFDEMASEWIKELIRRAKAEAQSMPEAAQGSSPSSEPESLSFIVAATLERPGAYEVYLKNIYNLYTDPLRLMAGLKEVSQDALEDAIRDAGFNGLIAPPAPGMKGPFAVVLNLQDGIRVPIPRGADEYIQ
jgi:hypothetical protein